MKTVFIAHLVMSSMTFNITQHKVDFYGAGSETAIITAVVVKYEDVNHSS